jgi:hypothetical protein
MEKSELSKMLTDECMDALHKAQDLIAQQRDGDEEFDHIITDYLVFLSAAEKLLELQYYTDDGPSLEQSLCRLELLTKIKPSFVGDIMHTIFKYQHIKRARKAK